MAKKDSPPPTVQPLSAAVSPRLPVVESTEVDKDAAVGVACTRIAHMAIHAAKKVVVLITNGPGADALNHQLRASLAANPRIVLASVITKPGAPVPDSSISSGHVHTSSLIVKPRPDIVVGTFLQDNTFHIVGSDPGPDGLGDESTGRRWVIRFKRTGR